MDRVFLIHGQKEFTILRELFLLMNYHGHIKGVRDTVTTATTNVHARLTPILTAPQVVDPILWYGRSQALLLPVEVWGRSTPE